MRRPAPLRTAIRAIDPHACAEGQRWWRIRLATWWRSGTASASRTSSIPFAAICAIDYQFEEVFLAGPKDMVFVVTGITHVAASFEAARHRLRWDSLPAAGILSVIVGLAGWGTGASTGAWSGMRDARAFGMRILAVKRHPAAQPAYVDNLWGLDGLDTLLAASDHVVLALPLTPETRCLIDERALGQMRSTAYLYNSGRGAVLDEAALIRCVQAGGIAGAGLDVFTEEPLPPDSPLWRLPTVLLTPHVGANGPRDRTDAASLFVDNLRRYRAGQELINRVDFQRGY